MLLVNLIFHRYEAFTIYRFSSQSLHSTICLIMLISQNGLIIIEKKKVNSYFVCRPFGMIPSWANVTKCRMGAGVGHQEPPQTKGQNLINIQTTAVPTGATSFTWRVVNWTCIKGYNLGCSVFIPTPLNPRNNMYLSAINIFKKIFFTTVLFIRVCVCVCVCVCLPVVVSNAVA